MKRHNSVTSMPLPLPFCPSCVTVVLGPEASGGQPDVSSTLSCSTRNQRDREHPFHHQTMQDKLTLFKQQGHGGWYLLLELLVNGVQRILDGDSFVVASCYFQTQWEVKVNLLDGRIDEVQFEYVLVFDAVWRGIELPWRVSMDMIAMENNDHEDGHTYHPVFCVSIGSTSSICWASRNINGFSSLHWTECTEKPYPSPWCWRHLLPPTTCAYVRSLRWEVSRPLGMCSSLRWLNQPW